MPILVPFLSTDSATEPLSERLRPALRLLKKHELEYDERYLWE
jgi:hypothetical protein